MSFPRYPAYKDSGVGWLGEVPEHWVVRALKRISPRQTVGIVVNPSEYVVEDGLPFIYGGDISEGRIDHISSRKISAEDSERNEKTRLQAGDLLTVRVGAPGITAVVPPECEGGNCASVMLVRRGAFNSGWLCFVMNSRVVRYQVEVVQYGAAQEQFNINHAVEFVIPTPARGEQDAITAFLDHETTKIDALVAEQERLIELLKEKRQAVISHAVTKGLDPSVPMKDSGVEWLGEVPAHWALRPLKSLAKFRSGGTPDKRVTDYWGGDIPWASAKDLKVDRLVDTIDHITRFALDDGAAALVPVNAVVVVVRGMILARYFPVTTLMTPMAINQDLKALLPSKEVDAGYLAWLLRASEPETLNCLDEAGHGTKALRMENWGGMTVPVPPLEEQVAISAALEVSTQSLDNGFAELEKAIQLLQERRTALISAAVTGQIDVRGWVPAEAIVAAAC